MTVRREGRHRVSGRDSNLWCADCDGDDPICQEVNPGAANIYEEDNNLQQIKVDDSDIAHIKIFNITGELVFSGNYPTFSRLKNLQKGILILSYFNSNNQLIKSEKTIIIN